MAQESVERQEGPQRRLLERYVLGLQEAEDERDAWRYLIGKMTPYPQDKYVPPLRPPVRDDRERPVYVAQLVTDERDLTQDPEVLALQVSDGERVDTIMLDDPATAAERLAGALFRFTTRGAYVAFWRGARHDFHLILRVFARSLVEQGYNIRPLAAGSMLKALIIAKGRHRWWLCDIPSMTGLDDLDPARFIDAFAQDVPHSSESLNLLHRALSDYQRLTLDLFEVGLRPTIGTAALNAAARTLDASAWKWRPAPLLVAMCRDGRGYRGGYAMAQPYIGPAWKADMNKAYTAALASPLPLETGMGWAASLGFEQPGVFLCRLSGEGTIPLYVAPWTGARDGFVPGYWSGGEALVVLPSAEFDGIRALGYTITPRFGFVFTRRFDFSAYVARIDSLLQEHPRGSAHAMVAKRFGVSVYGKLAERPDRVDVEYRAEVPGEEWWPFVTEEGEEVPDLWTRKTVVYRANQHVDAAADITAQVRGKLYLAAAAISRGGGRVLAADTDGLLADVDVRDVLNIEEKVLGGWRYEGHDARAAVAGTKAYAFGPEARVAGIAQVRREVVEMAVRGDDILVAGKRLAPPWEAGPMWVPLNRTLRSRGA